MALSPSALASLIQGNLSDAKGSNLAPFCTAVATGIVMSIVGKSFSTLDVGTISGAGTGTGTGITGLSASAMKSQALSLMSSKGDNADKLMQAIVSAVVTHLANASLSSVDTPVFLGSGSIIVGSIAVTASEMGNNIYSQLQSAGAKGSNCQNLAQAIAGGVASNILSSGTGTLTIGGAGTPSGPGTGSGTGTIS